MAQQLPSENCPPSSPPDSTSSGAIELQEDALWLRAKSLSLSKDESSFEQIRFGWLDANPTGQADKVQREEGIWSFENLQMDMCPLDQPGPKWSILAKQASLTKEVLDLRGLRVRLAGVTLPIAKHLRLYTDGTGATGWLVPQVRYDSEQGLDLSTPYHIRFARNSDLSLWPRILTETESWGGEAQFRYLFDEHNRLELDALSMANPERTHSLASIRYQGVFGERFSAQVDWNSTRNPRDLIDSRSVALSLDHNEAYLPQKALFSLALGQRHWVEARIHRFAPFAESGEQTELHRDISFFGRGPERGFNWRYHFSQSNLGDTASDRSSAFAQLGYTELTHWGGIRGQLVGRSVERGAKPSAGNPATTSNLGRQRLSQHTGFVNLWLSMYRSSGNGHGHWLLKPQLTLGSNVETRTETSGGSADLPDIDATALRPSGFSLIDATQTSGRDLPYLRDTTGAGVTLEHIRGGQSTFRLSILHTDAGQSLNLNSRSQYFATDLLWISDENNDRLRQLVIRVGAESHQLRLDWSSGSNGSRTTSPSSSQPWRNIKLAGHTALSSGLRLFLRYDRDLIENISRSISLGLEAKNCCLSATFLVGETAEPDYNGLMRSGIVSDNEVSLRIRLSF